MGRIKILLMSLVVIMAGCDDEVLVDGPAKGEWYFKIVNNTEHDVKISTMSASANPYGVFELDTVHLAPHDSITRPGEPMGWDYQPFYSRRTYLIFDDSLFYLCEFYEGKIHDLSHDGMVKEIGKYECVLSGPEVYLFRYEITEEKYRYVEEHLKIHSCKEELDKIIEEEGWTN